MSKLELPITPEEFQKTYYYRDDLVQFCKLHKLPYNLQKVELEKIILAYLTDGKIPTKSPVKKTKWVQDKLGLDCEVTENYKSNEVTRQFFKSVIGDSFKFNGAVMNYKKFHPNEKVIYQDLVNAYYADKSDHKEGIMTSERYYKGNRYNKFVREFYLNPENKTKTREEMIQAWNILKLSGNVNKL
jgi:hypothetical protein